MTASLSRDCFCPSNAVRIRSWSNGHGTTSWPCRSREHDVTKKNPVNQKQTTLSISKAQLSHRIHRGELADATLSTITGGGRVSPNGDVCPNNKGKWFD